MKFTFVTLFPQIVEAYFCDSILSRAIDAKLISVEFINPRDYTQNRHNKVDNVKIGGGAGMVMDFDSLDRTLKDISTKDSYIIIPQPAAKQFVNEDAKRLSKQIHIIFVCGRYEGIDERIIEKHADEVFSIGDFILTGGEIASLAMCDAISRHISLVLGNQNSLDEESFEENLLESPSFTKPNVVDGYSSPAILSSGHHENIKKFKHKLSLCKTKFHRPDLFKKARSIILL